MALIGRAVILSPNGKACGAGVEDSARQDNQPVGTESAEYHGEACHCELQLHLLILIPASLQPRPPTPNSATFLSVAFADASATSRAIARAVSSSPTELFWSIP